MTRRPRFQHLLATLAAAAAMRPVVTLLGLAALILAGLVGVSRLAPDVTLQAMVDQRNEAGAALAAIVERYEAIDDLLILVAVDDHALPRPDAEARLVAYADALSQAIRGDEACSTLVTDVTYRVEEGWARFASETLLPGAIWYLSDAEFDRLEQATTSQAITAAVRRAERLATTPGPGGAPLAKLAMQDPLGLRDLIGQSVQQRLPRWGGAPTSLTRLDDKPAPQLSPDGRAMLIRVRGAAPTTDLTFTARLMDAIRACVARTPDHGLTVTLTGGYAIANYSERHIRQDMIVSVTTAAIALQILFIIAYRRWWIFPFALLPTAVGVLTGFGAYALMDGRLTPLTAVMGGVLAGLGIDYAIHFLAHASGPAGRSEQRVGPRRLAVRCRRAGQRLGPPLAAACVTTVIGFGGIYLSSVRSLREFSVIGMLGLAASLALTFIALPALLAASQRLRAGRTGLILHPPAGWGMTDRVVASLIQRRRLAVTIGVTLAGVMLIVGVGPTLTGAWPGSQVAPARDRDGAALARSDISDRLLGWLDADMTNLHPKPNPPLDGQAKLATLFGLPPDQLLVRVQAPTDDELLTRSLAVEQRLERVADDLGLIATFSLADLAPAPSQADRRRLALTRLDADRIAADLRAALADSLFQPDAFESYLVFVRDLLAPGPSPDVATLRQYPALTRSLLPSRRLPENAPREAVVIALFGEPLLQLDDRTRAVEGARAALAGLPDATLTGVGVLGYDSIRAIAGDLEWMAVFATLGVFLWLLLCFRHIGDALLAMSPALVALVAVLAFMSVTGVRLNVVNLIAAPLLLGIAVDDGIVLLSAARLRTAAERRSALVGSLFAMTMTSASTALAFGSLIATSVPAIRSLGMLTLVGVAAALAASWGLLLPLLASPATLNAPPRAAPSQAPEARA